MVGIKFYIGMWLGLILGTVMEVVVRTLGGQTSTIVFVVCLIAAVQAIAISLYYQNLRYEELSLATLPLAAVVGVVFLGVATATSIAMGG